ncbi:hypothetical protein [Lentzea sp. NPDC059081]|uniref:hypothetical protein n=1 Tax=Lentzea sp. NPDC059081 TaxID=3346719 RepID=UPI0036905937
MAEVRGRVPVISAETSRSVAVQEIFAARLVSIDEAARSGAEWTDAGRGGYDVERVPVDEVGGLDLKPAELRDFVIRNAHTLLADLFG